MDPSCVKHYHLHECDPKTILNLYFSPTTEKQLFYEIVTFPMEELQKCKTSGNVLIDISSGPIIFHLLTICEHFNEIIVLEVHDSYIEELERWVNKEEEAFDWQHLSEYLPEQEIDCKKWLEKEEILRRKIKSIKIGKLEKDNPTEPFVLEKADCVLTIYLLQHVSKDKDSYCKNLKKLSSFLKVGGYLLLFGSFNGMYYKVGEHTFHILTYDEDFLRKAVADAGFTVEHLQILESTVDTDMIKYGNMYSIRALKEREI